MNYRPALSVGLLTAAAILYALLFVRPLQFYLYRPIFLQLMKMSLSNILWKACNL